MGGGIIWTEVGINIDNLTLLDDRRNCKLIQPQKNNETKIAFIVHSRFKSCDLRLILENGETSFYAKLPPKYSPVEKKLPRREWDTSVAELPPSPDADGIKYKYNDGIDIFILLIISTIILTLVLIYEILYRIFNRGRGIYPLSFTLNQTTDKNGSAEGGSNSGTILPTSSAQSSAEQQQQQSQPYDVTECPSTEDPKLESKFFEPNWKNIGIEYGELRENDTKICLPLPGRIHDERLKLLRAHYATQVVPGILETGHIDGGIYYPKKKLN
uniref:Uncharacterized protein n=1 Tax=Panagrolaimus superbus TaxID=310955 RepID=A0A914Z9S9_9BILA